MIMYWFKKIATVLLSVIIVFVAFEILLHIEQQLSNAHPINQNSPWYEKLNLSVEPWMPELYKEASAEVPGKSGQLFTPYLMWRFATTTTAKYFNIVAPGERKTWNPEKFSEPPTKIFMMGASSLMASSARDNDTIPSFISQELNSTVPRYEVRNFGEPGYVFEQEVLKLTALLRAGERPDIVLFYDGHNDVENAYDFGYPGNLGYPEYLMREKLEGGLAQVILRKSRDFIRDNCITCRLVYAAIQKINPQLFYGYDLQGYSLPDEVRENLAQATADDYAQTYSLLEKLAGAYHFRFMVFLQPSLMTETKLVGTEEQIAEWNWRVRDERQKAFHLRVRELLAQKKIPYLADLANIFADRTTAYYHDHVHVWYKPNKIAAEQITKNLLTKFGL